MHWLIYTFVSKALVKQKLKLFLKQELSDFKLTTTVLSVIVCAHN